MGSDLYMEQREQENAVQLLIARGNIRELLYHYTEHLYDSMFNMAIETDAEVRSQIVTEYMEQEKNRIYTILTMM